MLTFLLRKDLNEAAQLLGELHQHREQLGAGLQQVSGHAGKFLGTPSGLGLSFAAGCAAGWMFRHHRPEAGQVQRAVNQALPWFNFVRQFV